MSVSRPVDSPLGRVLPDDEGVRLEFVRTYDDPVEDVWSALTDPERVARWFGTWTGDPATGTVSFLSAEDPDGTPEPVTILECAAPTRLVVDMTSPHGAWRLAATLRPDGAGTSLLFEQRFANAEEVGSVGPGWHFYLDRLGAVVAGRPLPDVWDDYFPVLQEAYAAPGRGLSSARGRSGTGGRGRAAP
jgi:uncharacterized protein YndB with AHSA1/START domain